MSTNSRTSAAKILQRVIYHGESLSTALPDSSDPLTRDLCYGCLRWHEPLSALLDELLAKSLKKKDKDIECLLRLGLYQIIYQKTPDHAAVNETINALKDLKKPWAKKLLNGVMRNFLRQKDELLKTTEQKETVKHAFPAWLLGKVKKSWPDNWESILLESNQRAPMTLRVNLSQNTRDEYLEKLKANEIVATPVKGVDTAVMLDKPINVHELPGFAEGEVSVQDAAAQLASILLGCEDGMTVLDACAAPGGKTGHILESARNLSVIAIDSSESRLKRVTENLDRLNYEAKLFAVDAAETDEYAKDIMFDLILLDAPCSATGVIRRHPDIKVLRRPSDIDSLQEQQQRLLDALWGKVKKGGVLLYATCSVLPQENEKQIISFLGRWNDVEVVPIESAQGHGRQVFPGEEGMDGFYFAKLRKS